jgi:hypothetical protein
MGLFRENGVPTTSIVIEERQGVLQLVPFSARLSATKVSTKPFVREARQYAIPHIGLTDDAYAEEVQNVRAFGTEDQAEPYAELIANKLMTMRQSLEVTQEFHKIAAIQGKLLDADGTTVVYNWFDEFGISETVVDFYLDDSTFKFKSDATGPIIRHIQDVLGGVPYTYIHALCGSEFMDKFVTHPDVEAAYQRWQAAAQGASTGGQFFRESQVRKAPFLFQDIMWEEYRGFVGDITFMPTDQCRFFPVGCPDMFRVAYAPAPYPETVNTMGLPVYARQVPMQSQLGITLEACSNPLTYCTRPAALVKGLYQAGSGS